MQTQPSAGGTVRTVDQDEFVRPQSSVLMELKTEITARLNRHTADLNQFSCERAAQIALLDNAGDIPPLTRHDINVLGTGLLLESRGFPVFGAYHVLMVAEYYRKEPMIVSTVYAVLTDLLKRNLIIETDQRISIGLGKRSGKGYRLTAGGRLALKAAVLNSLILAKAQSGTGGSARVSSLAARRKVHGDQHLQSARTGRANCQ